MSPIPLSSVVCSLEHRKNLKRYVNECLFSGSERRKFISIRFLLQSCSWGAESIPFPFSYIHHLKMPWERWKRWKNGMSYDRFSPGKFLPRFPLYVKVWAESRTLNLSYYFAHHRRHVYDIDFDIIAIILQTMMCFRFPTHFRYSFQCFSKANVFYHKNEIDGVFYVFLNKHFPLFSRKKHTEKKLECCLMTPTLSARESVEKKSEDFGRKESFHWHSLAEFPQTVLDTRTK